MCLFIQLVYYSPYYLFINFFFWLQRRTGLSLVLLSVVQLDFWRICCAHKSQNEIQFAYELNLIVSNGVHLINTVLIVNRLRAERMAKQNALESQTKILYLKKSLALGCQNQQYEQNKMLKKKKIYEKTFEWKKIE